MLQDIPTIKVVNPAIEGEWMIINESDFDPGVHEVWKPKPKEEKKPKEPPKDETKKEEPPK